jgi:hypothetical protein
MTDMEIITWHLRGSCVTINSQLHSLLKMTSLKRDNAKNTRSSDRTIRQRRPDADTDRSH